MVRALRDPTRLLVDGDLLLLAARDTAAAIREVAQRKYAAKISA